MLAWRDCAEACCSLCSPGLHQFGALVAMRSDLLLLARRHPSRPQIARAKQEAAAVLARAEARAQALGASLGRQRTSEGAELVEASMRRLSEADEAAEQPSTLLKRCGGVVGVGVPGGFVCEQNEMRPAAAEQPSFSSRCEVPPCSQCTAALPYHAKLPSHCCPALPCLNPCPCPPLPCSVPGHDGGCYGLAFNRTGELLASGGADKCVKLWDPFTAAVKTTLRVSASHLSKWAAWPAANAAQACHSCAATHVDQLAAT